MPGRLRLFPRGRGPSGSEAAHGRRRYREAVVRRDLPSHVSNRKDMISLGNHRVSRRLHLLYVEDFAGRNAAQLVHTQDRILD
jgi:hypothetical protein